MTEILAAMTQVTGLVATVFEVITGNALLTFFVAASLIPVGFGVFRMAKRAARR